jgi:hypothetical protein
MTTLSIVQRLIVAECKALGEMLVAKNQSYGNSALEPLRIFSKASTSEQLLVRIDDKLSRLSRGESAGEDVVLDLLGYLILLRVQGRLQRDEDIPALEEAPHNPAVGCSLEDWREAATSLQAAVMQAVARVVPDGRCTTFPGYVKMIADICEEARETLATARESHRQNLALAEQGFAEVSKERDKAAEALRTAQEANTELRRRLKACRNVFEFHSIQPPAEAL